ncbi:MAG: aminotransferase class V-fold PLP-dependent enzyme, partial [candidate division WOR-3 bacterium]
MGIYFDNAATSYPKPKCVIEAMRDYLENIGANAGRSAHRKAQEASRLVFETREAVANLIGAEDSSRIIFTQNATEALNLVILGIGLNSGDSVLTSSIEHNSVMRPLRYLEKEKGIKIEIIGCRPDGELDPDDLKSKITKKTKLIILTHASNVIGTILPIREIGEIARRENIPFLVDGAQTVGCLSVNVDESNIDFLAFSGHKGLLGPQGV